MSDQAEQVSESLSEYEHRLAHEAALGEEIRDARRQAVFLLLFGESKRAGIEARNKLQTVDPEDAKAIRVLQNDANRYDEMADWVRTAMVKGAQAFKQLQMDRGEISADGETSED